MAGFLAGILYANVLAADEIAGIGIFSGVFSWTVFRRGDSEC